MESSKLIATFILICIYFVSNGLCQRDKDSPMCFSCRSSRSNFQCNSKAVRCPAGLNACKSSVSIASTGHIRRVSKTCAKDCPVVSRKRSCREPGCNYCCTGDLCNRGITSPGEAIQTSSNDDTDNEIIVNNAETLNNSDTNNVEENTEESNTDNGNTKSKVPSKGVAFTVRSSDVRHVGDDSMLLNVTYVVSNIGNTISEQLMTAESTISQGDSNTSSTTNGANTNSRGRNRNRSRGRARSANRVRQNKENRKNKVLTKVQRIRQNFEKQRARHLKRIESLLLTNDINEETEVLDDSTENKVDDDILNISNEDTSAKKVDTKVVSDSSDNDKPQILGNSEMTTLPSWSGKFRAMFTVVSTGVIQSDDLEAHNTVKVASVVVNLGNIIPSDIQKVEFTINSSGIYVFHVTSVAAGAGMVATQLVLLHNQKVVLETMGKNEGPFMSTSPVGVGHVTLALEAGDIMRLMTAPIGSGSLRAFSAPSEVTFSGFQIN